VASTVRTFAFFPVAVDVEFETAAMVEFEALAALPLPLPAAFAFFPVALVLATTALAVELAWMCKPHVSSSCGMDLPAALSFFGERANISDTVYVSDASHIFPRHSPIAKGPRASSPSSDDGTARAETTEAEMARSVRMDPKFFMMRDVKVRSVKLVEVRRKNVKGMEHSYH
jgi:hypothetical protein